MADPLRERELIEKIRALPAEKLAEIEDFVDFLRQRDDDFLRKRLADVLASRGQIELDLDPQELARLREEP